MWEVIAAVTATAIGIVALPFVTSIATNVIEDHRAERKRRRELYEELQVLYARGTSAETAPLQNEARAKLWSLMGPRDRDVFKTTELRALTYAASPSENDTLRYWVFGHERAARKLAKKLLTESSTSQPVSQSPQPADKSEG